MCGIAGITTHQSWTPVLQTALEKLQADLSPRGPDDRGLWLSLSSHAGLCHTRLAILDLSPAGHQPMADPSGRYHLTFNGEIYNFRELRAVLEATGETFLSQSDTEVLLRLYAREGKAMLSRLRGMFALAIWDEQQQSLFLARDPFGIKPLYYSLRGGVLVFASSVNAIRRCGIVPPELEARALQPYFETGSVPEPLTLLRDVFLLEAGHWAVWRNGTMQHGSYWELHFPGNPLTVSEPAALTRNALLDSLRTHFISDTPVGLFLSGGIDSTVLAALSRELGMSGLTTFSIGMDDHDMDESGLARRTAAHFGTTHHELQLDAERFEPLFDQFIACMDQPSIDGINTYAVSGLARQHGIKVVLSGLGGDELFGGYPSFQKVPMLARAARFAGRVPRLSQTAGALLERGPWGQRLRRVGSLLKRPPSLSNAFRAFRGIFSARDAQLLAAHYLGTSPAQLPASEEPNFHATTEMDRVSGCEYSLYMRNQLLRESDVMSMAHGLELRVPFVDRVLFETVSKLPSAVRLRPSKRLLIEAVPEIPSWVLNTPKRGFLFPYDKWMGARWVERFRASDAHIPGHRPNWYQRWSVFMLERWLESSRLLPQSSA